jgi:hypothetical protein
MDEISIKDFELNPFVSAELFAHYGGGYSKSLNINVNVITKEVNYAIHNRYGEAKGTDDYADFQTAIDAYNNIQRQNA